MADSEISEIHAAADYEALRAHCLVMARALRDGLQTCDTALSRDVPKVGIVRERLQQHTDDLVKLVVHLENLRA